MSNSNRYSDYQWNAGETKDIVRREIQRLMDKLEHAEQKSKKRKKRCQDQAEQIKGLNRELQQKKNELEQERKESDRRVLHAKIQARLDAWNFYLEGSGK